MPVGTAAAIIGGSLIGGAASVFGSSKAADAQKKAAAQAAATQDKQYQQTRTDLAPYRDMGSNALSTYAGALGLGGQAGYDKALAGYTQSPFLPQLIKDTQSAVDASSAARGGLYSGATAQAIGNKTGQLYLGDWNNYLSRLGGLVDTGQNAAAQTGNFGANAAAGKANAQMAAGNAQAGGWINAANGVNNALSQGASLYGAYKGGMFNTPAPPPSSVGSLPMLGQAGYGPTYSTIPGFK